MKTKYLSRINQIVLLSLILFTTNLFSQDLPESVHRNVVKEVLNKYYSDDEDKSFNAYNDGENLNLDLEFNINLTLKDIREINKLQNLFENSKEMAYTIISEISQSNVMKSISKKANYKNIILNFSTKTKDYKYIKHNFLVDVKALNSLSFNMNRGGFYRILKKI